jgi:hypothetical protein
LASFRKMRGALGVKVIVGSSWGRRNRVAEDVVRPCHGRSGRRCSNLNLGSLAGQASTDAATGSPVRGSDMSSCD